MPTQLDILKQVSDKDEPIGRQDLAGELGLDSYRTIQTPLDRLVNKGFLSVNDDHQYSITPEGKEELAEASGLADDLNEEKLGATEYQQFIHLGKITGVNPPELLKQTADHVWNGGDFNDLEWVAKAFQEMGIRQDLRNRWWHSWRTYLHRPMPAQLPEQIVEGETQEGKGSAKKKSSGPRSYILDETDKPVYVGEGLGDLDFDTAVDLAKIRAGRGRPNPVNTAAPASTAEEMIKLFELFQKMSGGNGQSKTWVMRPSEDGSMQVEEAQPGQPMIIGYPQSDKPQKTIMVHPTGETEEVEPGQPIIIKQPAPPAAVGAAPEQYLIDRRTGAMERITPGQPIIIQTQPASPLMPIELDKDGNPRVAPNLDTWLKLEDWKIDQKRKQDKHDLSMEIGEGFKELLKNASGAIGDVLGKEG